MNTPLRNLVLSYRPIFQKLESMDPWGKSEGTLSGPRSSTKKVFYLLFDENLNKRKQTNKSSTINIDIFWIIWIITIFVSSGYIDTLDPMWESNRQ